MSTPQTVLITGAGSGIGAATATRFADEGFNVVIADRKEDAAIDVKNQLMAKHGDRIDHVVVDVAKREQVEAMVAFTQQRFGSLDVLINNAGIAGSGPVKTASAEHWQRVIDVNLNAVFWGSQAALKIMTKQGAGNIVNVASIAGLAGDYGFSSYSATKAAVVNFTRSTALDHARDNIRVNAICPGAVATPLMAGVINNEQFGKPALEAIPMGRAAVPEEIANVIYFVSSDQASFMTGAVLAVDGGITAWTGQPRFF